MWVDLACSKSRSGCPILTSLQIEVIQDIGVGMVGRQFPAKAEVELVLIVFLPVADPTDQVLEFILDPSVCRVIGLWINVRVQGAPPYVRPWPSVPVPPATEPLPDVPARPQRVGISGSMGPDSRLPGRSTGSRTATAGVPSRYGHNSPEGASKRRQRGAAPGRGWRTDRRHRFRPSGCFPRTDP